MKKYILIVFTFMLSIPQVKAQNENTDTIKYLLPENVIITSSRINLTLNETPFAISLIDRSFLNTMPKSVAMDEALKLTPGVKIDNQANGNRLHLSIRGQGILTERGIRGIKLLLDGIPMNDPTGFAPDFFDVDLNTVDRIEVLRGTAASLYGASSSGGIINITTQNSPDVPLFGNVDGSFGSNDFWKFNGQFGGKVNDVNYNFSFSRAMGSGYRDHTNFRGNIVYTHVNFFPAENIKLTPIFGYTHFYHENPEGINMQQYIENPKQANPDAVPYNEYLETERSTEGLTGLILLGKSEIQFNGYVKTTKFTEANNHTFNYRDIITPGGSIQYSLSIGDSKDFFVNKIILGSDLQWQSIDEHRVDNIFSLPGDTLRSKEKIEQQGVGLFAIDQVKIGKNLSVLLNIRYDMIKNELKDEMKNPYDLSGNADFSKTTGRMGLIYNVSENVDLYANWGQGFLPPATEELAQNPDHFGGFNTHLTYATSNGFEMGFRTSFIDKAYFDIAGFYLKTENDFDRYRIQDSLRNQETFYRNAGSSNRIGFEFYGRYMPLVNLDLQMSYTYSNFKYTNTEPIHILMDDPSIEKFIVDGNYLPNSPMHQLYFDVQYNFAEGFFAGFAAETISKTFIDGANLESEAAAGYTLLNARIGYNLQIGGHSGLLSLNGRNLADTKYVAFTEPDPGGNAYQPGAGREFFINARFGL